MKIKVLGCHGGNDLDHGLTSFLVNDSVAIDAGSLTTTLTHNQQMAVRHVFLSHIHLDHVCTLPFLVDNQFGNVPEPLNIYASGSVIEAVQKHVFNDLCWPDFSVLPGPERPSIRYHQLEAGEAIHVEGLEIKAVAVSHLVPTTGYIVTGSGGSWVYGCDTGETELLWNEINELENAKMLFLECSFPSELETLAEESRHLTPASVGRQLKKLKKQLPVRIYHCKPIYLPRIESQIRNLEYADIELLREGEIYKV